MSWPSLLKAKDNVRAISNEIGRMLKESNSLSKKDIANYRETVLSEIDRSVGKINAEIKELQDSLKSHRKYFEAKSVFLRRHNRRL